MRSNRAGREIELLTNFPVRHSSGRHLGYLKFLSRQLITRGRGPPQALLARRAQLLARALPPGNASQCVEHLSRRPQRRARLCDASLTPEPGGDRTLEVKVAQEILQTMGFRTFVPLVAACPGCGRTTSTVFQELASEIQTYIHAEMPNWRKVYPGVEKLNVAVMGCIVNGPGESKHADIGISLPGTGEQPTAPVFIDGKKAMTLRGATVAADFKNIVVDYIERRYGTGGARTAAE